MAFDLSEFERRHDFDLATQAIGSIRCGTLKAGMLSVVQKLLQTPNVGALIISRQVLGMVGSKNARATDDAETQKVTLTAEDVQQITEDEVETFAGEFVAHNEWLLQSHNDGEKQINAKGKGDNEASSDYLVRVLRLYLDERDRRLKKMLEPLSERSATSQFAAQVKKLMEPLSSRFLPRAFSDSTLESLRRNFSLSDQLQDTINAFNKRTLDYEIARSAIEPAQTQIPELLIQKNPLSETTEHLSGLRSMASKSTELLNGLNATAVNMQVDFQNNARSTKLYAQVAIGIAVLSFIASSFFSWMSYRQSEKSDTQSEIFKTAMHNLIAAQEKDRAVLVRALKETRQSSQVKSETSRQSSIIYPKGRGSGGKATP